MTMIATQRLYLNADRKKLLPHGHKDAAFLYCSPGDEIPDNAAEQFGLKDGALPEKAKAPAADKGGKAPANKGGKMPANKGGKKPADKEAVPQADKTGEGTGGTGTTATENAGGGSEPGA